MRYEGDIYRPPSEAYSLLVQVTIGCAHNKCTFCTMFKDKQFRVRNIDEVIEDLNMARARYSHVRRMFLCDGDALCLATDKIVRILDHINTNFPECERVTLYGSPMDVLRKTPEDLVLLREKGVSIIYIGVESGNDIVLERVCKGVDSAQLGEAIRKIEAAGIEASVTFISGLGGKELWREHALDCARLISETNPSYVGLLTLLSDPAAPLTQDVNSGKFELLTPEEVLAETALMMQHIDVQKKCVFRSNHASNYVSLKGTLPDDKNRMISQLKHAMENTGILKDERFRMF